MREIKTVVDALLAINSWLKKLHCPFAWPKKIYNTYFYGSKFQCIDVSCGDGMLQNALIK